MPKVLLSHDSCGYLRVHACFAVKLGVADLSSKVTDSQATDSTRRPGVTRTYPTNRSRRKEKKMAKVPRRQPPRKSHEAFPCKEKRRPRFSFFLLFLSAALTRQEPVPTQGGREALRHSPPVMKESDEEQDNNTNIGQEHHTKTLEVRAGSP